MTDLKYIEQVQKGSTVSYGNKQYRVQDDGKGYLHIVVHENGRRKKIGIDNLPWWEYGSKADWAFNEWWRLYPDYELFESFAITDKLSNQ